jgi:hypothetical protein
VSVPQDQASPGTPPPVLPGRGSGQFLDWDSFNSQKLSQFEAWIEPNLGGYSIPPPPFRLARTTPSARLWLRSRGRSPTQHTPFEPPGSLGGIVLGPGARRAVPLNVGAEVTLGAEPVDGLFTRPTDWHRTGSNWVVWSADPRFVVSAGVGGPARHRFVLSNPGEYEVAVVGQTSPGLGVSIDHRVLRPSRPSQLNSMSRYGTLALGQGTHTVELVADPKGLSYVQAISIERVKPSPAGVVCVGGRRYPVAWNAPVVIRLLRTRQIVNCNVRAVRLDWVQRQ